MELNRKELVEALIKALYVNNAFYGDLIVDGVYVETYNTDETENGGFGFVVDNCWHGEYYNTNEGKSILIYDMVVAIDNLKGT